MGRRPGDAILTVFCLYCSRDCRYRSYGQRRDGGGLAGIVEPAAGARELPL